MPPDPVLKRALYLRKDVADKKPNRYFVGLYSKGARQLRGMLGREHTGQVDADTRVKREQMFS
jgi:hypothetical protein